MIARKSERGQAAVETALVMPLMVFLVLGILQLGLLAHARVMTKYAAYRAARVGAMHHANNDAMTNAALLHLLPVWANSSDTITSTRSIGDVAAKLASAQLENRTTVLGAQLVRTVICGPTISELRGTGSDALSAATQQARHGIGSSNEVDFDDPANHVENGSDQFQARSIREFNRTRLRVQVQYLYRMPIPFANWVLAHSYLGVRIPSVLMMGEAGFTELGPHLGTGPVARQAMWAFLAARSGVYVIPINASYAMRMHSNFFLTRQPLPARNECIHYGN